MHAPTRLHGHILVLVLIPTEPSVVFNANVDGFISDHVLVDGQLEFIRPSVPKLNTAAFRRYHKIKMQSLRCNLANCSFISSPGSTVSALYEQYTRNLSSLFDKHAPMVS